MRNLFAAALLKLSIVLGAAAQTPVTQSFTINVSQPATAPPAAAFYSPTSFWNTPIPASAAVDANSAAMVATALTPYASNAALSNSGFGIGFIDAAASDPTYTVKCLLYYCGQTGHTFQIPLGAKPSSGSDGHLVVVSGTQELDMWQAVFSNGSWSAGGVFLEPINGWGANGLPGTAAGGIYAAGFSGMGGVITPQDIASGVIRHALSLATPKTLRLSGPPYTGPATATDGTAGGVNYVPEGAHIRLNPSFNVSSLSPAWVKMVATALQTYGAYVSDTSGSLFLYGQTDSNAGNATWASVGVSNASPSLASIPWSQMQVLNLKGPVLGTPP